MYHFKFDNEELGRSLVVFLGEEEGSPRSLGSVLDTVFKSYSENFNNLFLIFPNYIRDYIDGLRASSEFRVDLGRLDEAEVQYISFDDRSLLENIDGGTEYCLDGLYEVVKDSGVKFLIEKRLDKVIMKSPPGTVFQKPSGDLYREFIRTSELAVGTDENMFLAFCLLRSRPQYDVENIWIDTAGISSIASYLCHYLKMFKKGSMVKFDSFQSYGGYQEVNPNLRSRAWVIISASTSNNLGCEINNCWDSIKHDGIVTILSYKETEYDVEGSPIRNGDGILLNISQYSVEYNDLISYGDEIPVRVEGENFTVQIEAPNKVLLRKPHAPKSVSEFTRVIAESNSVEAFKMIGSKLYEVFFSFSQFYNELEDSRKNKFLKWLSDSFEWYAPRDVKFLIYDKNDAETLSLVDLLCQVVGLDNSITHVDIKEIVGAVDNSGSAVIVSPVISSGRAFIGANRDLRIVNHDKQRVFIAPFAMFSSGNDFDLFARSLVLGPSGLKYQFLNYRSIFVGERKGASSWEAELDAIEGLPAEAFKKRASLLRQQSKGLQGYIGFNGSNDEKLNFEHDFAFWLPGYKSRSVNHVAVYLTISAILQNLRETPYSLKNRESLFKHVYQHSVLDPENFNRFNDGLLQSCLWRAANSSEVDYSETELGREMVDILMNLARELSTGAKNGLYDILIGVAIQKIKLSKENLKSIVEYIDETLPDDEVCQSLIRFLKTHLLKEIEEAQEVF